LPEPGANVATQCRRIAHDARRLALAAVVDIGVFFGVLMVGFAYVWYRGDLDWVRAVSRQPAARPAP
jgi:NADH-quinone oxidoreductase subunit A